jgi:hypothetical protein
MPAASRVMRQSCATNWQRHRAWRATHAGTWDREPPAKLQMLLRPAPRPHPNPPLPARRAKAPEPHQGLQPPRDLKDPTGCQRQRLAALENPPQRPPLQLQQRPRYPPPLPAQQLAGPATHGQRAAAGLAEGAPLPTRTLAAGAYYWRCHSRCCCFDRQLLLEMRCWGACRCYFVAQRLAGAARG